LAAFSGDLTLGTWSSPTSVTGGSVQTYGNGLIGDDRNNAGNVFLLAFGDLNVSNVVAGGANNANGGMVTLAAGHELGLGSLSNRSTTGAAGALTAFNNDTGLGASSGLNVLGNTRFLPNSVVLTDGSNNFSVNS